MMDRYHEHVTASTYANRIYYADFAQHMAAVEAATAERERQGRPFDVDTMDGLFSDLHTLTRELKEPAESLLAHTQLMRFYVQNDVVSPYAREIREYVERQWTGFEKREGSVAQLAVLRDTMRAMGITFVKQWKYWDHGGYVGYAPLTLPPLTSDLYERMKLGSRSLKTRKEANRFKVTAVELNELLGEKRYDPDITTAAPHQGIMEDEPGDDGEGTDRYEVEMFGSWRRSGISADEFSVAYNAKKRGHTLHTNPELTRRLARLME
jgi:hypothetical protein